MVNDIVFHFVQLYIIYRPPGGGRYEDNMEKDS